MYIAAGAVLFILLISLIASASSPLSPWKLGGSLLVKLAVGAFFLFLLNSFGGDHGIHVPINLITSAVAGVLGIAGVAALAVIQIWIIG
ncbi:pro-sigmaK processing inhibitor BofA family protein [Bacillus thermotolerans]|uniref:Inhibitor of pro-sigmaK processing BofA n=1 Tax=Bacillus thermotolerans TaxID=1221996 RepID=A0A0F5I269_BACTR|nr:pro-sigmaK processing inhibitor BofA family protein [Bacillus thermotolerans]KKB33337.1 Inhibitor of pro-sigmaK processing BofA [Bacillus thermotolerans]KKB35824.1 Inhibitor of pro-sigmaK processing BofA [Bacillus thermotolerans]KKB39375.1 Inhibitor of pro-sigmaK processing BofA [Bacillus thermotolerans]